MESSSKIKLDVGTLSDLTTAHLGSAAVGAEELADGWFNTIYRIDLADGRTVVVKMAPPPEFPVMRYERNLMQTEVDVLRRLAGVDGVPVPRVLAYDTSGNLHPHDFFLMDYVAGRTYSAARESMTDEERARIDVELGRVSARVNAITAPSFGRCTPDHCTRDNWYESLLAMVGDVLDDADESGAVLPLLHETLRAAYESARSILQEVTTPRLVLWDLHTGNVFVNDNRMTAIIDVDRAFWGDPLMEFFFRSIAHSSPAFFEGYANPNGILDEPGAKRRIWLYDLYLAMILITECSFRGYPESHIAWANGRFAELTANAQAGWLPVS